MIKLFQPMKWSTLLIFLSLSQSLYSQAYQLLMYEGYPPFSYGTSEQPKGLFYAIVSSITGQMENIEVEFQVLPWTRALSMAKNGEGYLIGLLKTEERLKVLDYSETFYSEELVLYKNTRDMTDYSSGISSLTGKRVGMNRNWSYGPNFDAAKEANFFQIDDAKDDKGNLFKLSAGRTDVIPINRLTAQLMVKELKLENKVSQASDAIDLTPVHIATSKNTDSTAFFDKFNQKLRQFKKSGQLNLLIKEYEQQLLN